MHQHGSHKGSPSSQGVILTTILMKNWKETSAKVLVKKGFASLWEIGIAFLQEIGIVFAAALETET